MGWDSTLILFVFLQIWYDISVWDEVSVLRVACKVVWTFPAAGRCSAGWFCMLGVSEDHKGEE